MTQAILPAFTVAGIVDAGSCREHSVAGPPGSPIPATTSCVIFDPTALGDSPEIFRIKIRIPSFCAVTFVLVTFTLQAIAEAVIPPPDGAYPGGNTAEGQNALLSLTTGTYNTAVGSFSLRSNTLGSSTLLSALGHFFANTANEVTATVRERF